MRNLSQRALLLRAMGGLLLLMAGAIGFTLTAPDSWLALAALLVHFGGMALLYNAIHLWMNRFGGRARIAAAKHGTLQRGCAVALLRAVLLVGLVGAAGFWLWFTVLDLNEIRLVLSGGRVATAQVIGRDIVPPTAVIGYINYSYRTSSTSAPVSRFAVPHAAYSRYRIGEPFEVTYAAADPRVHRIGRVGWPYAVRRLLYWVLVLANGAAYLYLPLWLLEFRRQLPGSPARS